jgi:hypothetical protein
LYVIVSVFSNLEIDFTNNLARQLVERE